MKKKRSIEGQKNLPHFKLSRPDGRTSSIILVVNHRNEKLRRSVKISIDTAKWDFKRERVYQNYSEASRINLELDKIQDKCEEIIESTYRVSIVDSPLPEIDSMLTTYFNNSAPQIKKILTVKECVVEYFSYINSRVTEGTIANRERAINHFESFLKTKNLKMDTMMWSRVSEELLDNFVTYLFETLKQTNNTVASNVSILNSIIFWSYKKKYHQFEELLRVQSMNKRSYEKPTTTFALTKEELERIANLELEEGSALENIRLQFLIGCYTSLRFSDFSKLQSHDWQDKFLRVYVRKSPEPISIPIVPQLRKLIETHDISRLQEVSTQRINLLLKELGKLAELNEDFELIRFQGKKRISRIVKKWEILSTHCARRTFITQSLERGVPQSVVMRISGHKDMKSFEKYIKHSNRYVHDVVTKAWEM